MITLTVEQERSLLLALNDFEKDELISFFCYKKENKEEWYDGLRYLDELTVEQLCKAIYVGYEVETTKEQKLLEYVEALRKNTNYHDLVLQGKLISIKTTLNILGIEIEGVNK